ncbi:MAG TPA: YjbQ family protein [Thioploca sp.]|nr:MAG: YjbQ family protein [Gammaproteobacteria bacterium]HDN27387.1 YjbQ family protein [Thioploca sp.]
MPVKNISVHTPHQGLFNFTQQVATVVRETGLREGLCTLFVQHTSASLVIQENADPSAKRDLERWLNRLVPERDSLYTHTLEGADDMPAHIKSALTATSLAIPIVNGQLALGTWQGIYLWEHRRHGGQRSVVIHIGN